ncbi:hypothetical protein HYC85_027834 [Camellia sinensis]|uniref:Pectinesterase n=1 Tax=Camellia sinensis TaxID=4442 RepID=A0A7J7FTE6_CAMSI|nr:hypothetical protein HYC85_027834 [Camellia sinensis]
MDTINSFKGYGKVDPVQEQAFRRTTRKRIVILIVSAVVLVAVIIGAVVGTVIHKRNDNSFDDTPSSSTSPAASLKAVCSVTQYPDSCFSSIKALEASNSTADPKELFKLSLQVVFHELSKIASFPDTLISMSNDAKVKSALGVCKTVIKDAVDRLNDSISSIDANPGDKILSVNSNFVDEVRLKMKDSTEFTSNSLAIVAKVLGILGDVNVPIHRKLLGVSDSGFPEWVRAAERRLLQAATVKPNLTVAIDGSGDYKTIGEAVAKVPKKTVAGKGFIAKDIGFWNTAGAAKHQAVAVRCASDMSVFYQCAFNAFQDTLYAYANRQFYRDCDITGTIDFIFGNAAVVFQNCNIQPRQPMSNQFDTITAQGKSDKNQNTGISIQKCTMSPLDSLTAPTYLGRPWKNFSTTIVMQTNIESFLNPLGWVPWVGYR